MNPSFQSLSNPSQKKSVPDIIKELEGEGYKREFKKGDVLVKPAQPISEIPIILEGAISVYQLDDDYREMLLYYLEPGDMCIMSFMGGLYNESSKIKAVASEESRVLLIPVRKIGMIIKHHPEWIEYIFDVYHQRFHELLDVVNAVAFKKMDERLVHFIEKRREITGKSTIKITHEELAKELGTARVVISRLLKELEKKGVLELGRNKITLL
ncbi:MAG: Crp/Fnr family transcriptional regulator [Balneolaceae bacterium]|nr:Crp/Fnr family transcriptional regulator [Balneolaceae bacterium]